MYERVGGDAFFETLTRRFYAAVATDPVLMASYPSDPEAFEEARRHLCGFLIQFWGGPQTYSEERGHPRLRLRHQPFVIGKAERDAWVRHMADAVRAAGLSSLDEAQMLAYFESAATALINAELPDASAGPGAEAAGAGGAEAAGGPTRLRLGVRPTGPTRPTRPESDS